MVGRSRYDGVEQASVTVPDGHGGLAEVAYLLPRVPRDPAAVRTLARHRVVSDDRIDLVEPPLSRRPAGVLADRATPTRRSTPTRWSARRGGHRDRRSAPRSPEVCARRPAAHRPRRADDPGSAAGARWSRGCASVTVTETDEERSAFTLVLDAGRSGPAGRPRHPGPHRVAADGGRAGGPGRHARRGAHRADGRDRHHRRADPR